ncbi:DUF7351 domain-containing protein [Haloarchaeobius sp. DT45]|uniref:DUF7351 domain-containing protein n=1 Tax=Haloarchaeobius sp. DT45 TaxID=3446116 RepID=UPI003F6A973A
MPDDGASDAFQVLGNEIRMTVLAELVTDDGPTTRSFSELFEATDADTSAGFAYHLRQLVGRYVRKREDDRYELTYAGLQVARAIAAGEFTDSVDRDPVSLPDPCPFCGETALTARVVDNVTTVGCTDCDRDLLELPFPPAGYATRKDEDLPTAFDRYHRHRIATFADGICPTCGGAVFGRVERVDDAAPETDIPVVTARFDCDVCSDHLGCPVALTVLDHPDVVAFYHDHGEGVQDRPVWNVGAEWRETVLSTDPLAVRVTTRLADEELALFVGRDLTVVESQRVAVDGEPEADAVSG